MELARKGRRRSVSGGLVRFDEAVVAAKGGAIVRGPKTRASIRTVALDDDSLAMLGELRQAQDELARLCDREMVEQSFVFSVEPGGSTPLYPDTVSHGFSVIRQRAGLPSDLHVHSLRHFHATLLAGRGQAPLPASSRRGRVVP